MKKLYPVIHVGETLSVEQDVNTARESGADGVFLISHFRADEPLLKLAAALKNNHRDFFIGINLLTVPAAEAIVQGLQNNLDAIWTDTFGLGDPHAEKLIQAALLSKAQRQVGPSGWINPNFQHYGGFDFKYQKPQEAADAKTALEFVHVLTTSGDRTGQPPRMEKLKRIRNVIGDFPLAVASGIDHENIKYLKTVADHFLIASSITDRDRGINPQRLQRVVGNLRN